MSRHARHVSVFRRLFAVCLLFASAALPLQAWAVDTDGDGVDDSIDAFPNNPEATMDTDGDGKPDSIDYSKVPIVFSDTFDGTVFQSGWSATSLWLVSGGSAAYKLNVSQGFSGSFSRVFNVPSGSGELGFRHVRLDNCASGDLWVDSNFNRGLFQASRGTWELTTVNLAVGSHLVEWKGRCNSLANTVALRVDEVVFKVSSLVEDNDDDNDGVPDSSDAFPFNATESLDTDHDGIGNNADTDDDGDGIPDYIDANPLDAAIHSEITLPVNSTYKGGQVREVQTR